MDRGTNCVSAAEWREAVDDKAESTRHALGCGELIGSVGQQEWIQYYHLLSFAQKVYIGSIQCS